MDDRGKGAVAYRFGPYTLVPHQRLLMRDDVPFPIAPKLFDLLCLLVMEAGRLVTRERVIEAVWPNVFVSETNLRQKVWLLRKALKAPVGGVVEYIETVPRQGYRFLAPVTLVEAEPSEVRAEAAPAPARARSRFWVRGLMGAVNVLLLTITVSSDRPAGSIPPTGPSEASVPSDTRRSVALLRLRRHSGDPEDGWITDALTEMLRAELAASTGFRLVPAETVERFARGLSPPPVLTLSPQSLARVRQTMGGEWVVAGALVAAGSGQDAGLRVDLLVQCTRSRQIIATVSESGTRRELMELASRTGHELRLALGAAQARQP